MDLVIFDVDGTLVDSQGVIVSSMQAAFAAGGLAFPGRAAVLDIVGLSLPVAMARLAPQADGATLAAMLDGYREAHAVRLTAGAAVVPLFDGAAAALRRLGAAGRVLAVATGKGRRGLDALMAAHGFEALFAVTQTADDAPSKPHPGMVRNILDATGMAPSQAVMVGDTTYDMAMARSAGVRALGVSWGYHRPEALIEAGADAVIDRFDALDAALAA